MGHLVHLTATEEARICFYREYGVLEELVPERLPCEHGTILVPCGDGHHFHDFYQHHSTLCGHAHGEPMHHPLSLNGGALLIPEDSPLHMVNGQRVPDDVVLLRHILGAVEIKGAKAVVLAAHAPCGMMRAYGLSIDEGFALLVEAKDRVKEMLRLNGVSGVTVAIHFHAYLGPKGRRTYQFRRPAWDALQPELRQEPLAQPAAA